MRLSDTKLAHAKMVRDRELAEDSYIGGLKRVGLVGELEWMGVKVSLQSVLTKEDLSEMYRIVVFRICERYGL